MVETSTVDGYPDVTVNGLNAFVHTMFPNSQTGANLDLAQGHSVMDT